MKKNECLFCNDCCPDLVKEKNEILFKLGRRYINRAEQSSRSTQNGNKNDEEEVLLEEEPDIIEEITTTDDQNKTNEREGNDNGSIANNSRNMPWGNDRRRGFKRGNRPNILREETLSTKN